MNKKAQVLQLTKKTTAQVISIEQIRNIEATCDALDSIVDMFFQASDEQLNRDGNVLYVGLLYANEIFENLPNEKEMKSPEGQKSVYDGLCAMHEILVGITRIYQYTTSEKIKKLLPFFRLTQAELGKMIGKT